jgi:UDP-N-acetylmuramoylalanine--D-glutamate ligase
MDITTEYFDGKKVLIFGLGTNGGGLGTLQFLLKTKAAIITVTDQKKEVDFVSAGITLPNDSRIIWHFGAHQESDFRDADIIVKNPSVKWDHPLLFIATESGADIIMDSTIFMALCKAKVIGVTGSKGKTTTASLIAHILENAGHTVVRAGISQIGVLSELPKVTKDSTVVFELSSWRLSGLTSIQKSPHISVLVNLYPDHLNYYDSMEAYAQDKKIITSFQKETDFFILPQDSKWHDFFAQTKAQIKTFGTDDSSCAWQDEDSLWMWQQNADQEAQMLIRKEDTFFAGEHLFSNMLAAALAAKSLGIPVQDIQKGLKTFTGVPHRFELVREVAGVSYINDTTATIPSATLASVQAIAGPVVLLAGGSDKNLPLDDLLTAIEKTKVTILFAGTGTDKILGALPKESQDKVTVVESMVSAVAEARQIALDGDTVILAPGAASFGMFVNEFDRGEKFIKEVQKLT